MFVGTDKCLFFRAEKAREVFSDFNSPSIEAVERIKKFIIPTEGVFTRSAGVVLPEAEALP